MTLPQPVKKRINPQPTIIRDAIVYAFTLIAIWLVLFPTPTWGLIASAPILVIYLIKTFSIKQDTRFFNILSAGLTTGVVGIWLAYTYQAGTDYSRITVIALFIFLVSTIYYISRGTSLYARAWHYQLRDMSTLIVGLTAINITSAVITHQIINIVILIITLLTYITIYSTMLLLPLQSTRQKHKAIAFTYTKDVRSTDVSKARKTLKFADPIYSVLKPVENSQLAKSYAGRKYMKNSVITTIVINSGLEEAVRKNPNILPAFSGRKLKDLRILGANGQKLTIFNIFSQVFKGKRHVTIIAITAPNKLKQTIKITIAGEQFYLVSLQALKKEYSYIEESI